MEVLLWQKGQNYVIKYSLIRFCLSMQAEHMPTALIEEIFLWQFYDAVLLGWAVAKNVLLILQR